MFGSLSPIDQNLVLTGYIGPGQLAIARRTAERLRMPFVDFGTRFEDHAEMTADDLKAQYGDSRLRTMESEVLENIALMRGTVLHVGGQVLGYNGHYDMLRATGVVIALVATLDAVLQRLHLSLGARYHDPRERAAALAMLRREWSIRGVDGLVEIDTSAMSEDAIIQEITTRYRTITGVIDWRG